MTDKLPPNLLKLFAPRPPLPYVSPLDNDPEKRVGCIVTGIAAYVDELKNYDPDYVPWKSITERRKEKAEAKQKKANEELQAALKEYDPEKDPNIDGDPFNTLFVTHLSSELTENDLLREFEIYGQIKKIRLIRDKAGNSRCYAFIEFEREKDMRGK
ncbi:MAG: U1 small nuclear ribonucleoprotein of 70kDa MW N terminal-domain-containing protein [Benjaminiella poitrasii]|nr:MAG: U1 small nuclear ribonucleoprotein of 70kDa MW N terminal-domain-containing protein [Benjaminiella poitrasii]